jgi:tRNA threonylcarbamoyladenosine biosynthesis protein TsaB
VADSLKLIAVDTSGRVGRLALAADGRVLVEREITAGMRHGRDLLPTIDAALRDAGWPGPRAIDVVAISIGPGSFTGLRISVMFARTLCWQTGARAVGVPTLAALAAGAPADVTDVAAVVDAQRGGVYWAVYQRQSDGSLLSSHAEAVSPPEDVVPHLGEGTLVIGSGLNRYADVFARFPQADESLWLPKAAAVAELGWAMHCRGEYTPADRLEPLYVRRPAPEEVWERRQRGGR